jgi:hypothetical protein
MRPAVEQRSEALVVFPDALFSSLAALSPETDKDSLPAARGLRENETHYRNRPL